MYIYNSSNRSLAQYGVVVIVASVVPFVCSVLVNRSALPVRVRVDLLCWWYRYRPVLLLSLVAVILSAAELPEDTMDGVDFIIRSRHCYRSTLSAVKCNNIKETSNYW